MQEKISRHTGKEQLSLSLAEDEVVADFCQDLLTDKAALETMAKENPTGFQALVEWVKDFLAKIREKLSGSPANSEELQIYRAMEQSLKDAFGEAWGKGIVGAVQTHDAVGSLEKGNKNTTTEGGITKYSHRGYQHFDLSNSEWDLLNRTLAKEIESAYNWIDKYTKWCYKSEKGLSVFAIYGVGNGTDPTPLLAVKGKTADKLNVSARIKMEALNGIDADRKRLDSYIEILSNKQKRSFLNLYNDVFGRYAVSDDEVYHGTSTSHGRADAAVRTLDSGSGRGRGESGVTSELAESRDNRNFREANEGLLEQGIARNQDRSYDMPSDTELLEGIDESGLKGDEKAQVREAKQKQQKIRDLERQLARVRNELKGLEGENPSRLSVKDFTRNVLDLYGIPTGARTEAGEMLQSIAYAVLSGQQLSREDAAGDKAIKKFLIF